MLRSRLDREFKAPACLGLAERTFGKNSPEYRTVLNFTKEKRAGFVASIRGFLGGFIVYDNRNREKAEVLAFAVLFDTIHVSSTVARPDDTFGFSFMPFDPDFEAFHEASRIETERVKAESGLKSPYGGIDVVYFTVLRKVKFTMMEHAHGLGDGGAIPFLTFGETFEENDRLVLPHSLRVHHSMVDGQHVGLYYERLEEIMNGF